MQTLTATDARKNFFSLLKETLQNHGSTKIQSRTGTAVLLSEQDYEELVETAELSMIPGLKDSLDEADKNIKKNEVYSLEEAFSK